MNESEYQSIPANLYAGLSLEDLHPDAPSRIERLNKILGDQQAKFAFEFDPYTKSLCIQIFSQYGTIYSVIPEGDSNYES